MQHMKKMIKIAFMLPFIASLFIVLLKSVNMPAYNWKAHMDDIYDSWSHAHAAVLSVNNTTYANGYYQALHRIATVTVDAIF